MNGAPGTPSSRAPTPASSTSRTPLRDALVAACTLNIFNNHCDRVRMANIAQMINVLQAMILTDNEKMLLTPTWHVFEMYTVHHDAKLLPSELQTPDCRGGRIGCRSSTPRRHATVRAKPCHPVQPQRHGSGRAVLRAAGRKRRKLSGRVLTAAEINAHNTFDQPEKVKAAVFKACKTTDTGFAATLPAKSVVVLELE